MTDTFKRILRDAGGHYLKAAAFAIAIYLLLIVIYGGTRISFLWLVIAVAFAFTVAYIPHLIQVIRANRGKAQSDDEVN